MNPPDENSVFLYWRIGTFLFIVLVLTFARYLLQRWYASKLTRALTAQQRTIEVQQRERDELDRIESNRILRAYETNASPLPPQPKLFSEEPPCDYETAIKMKLDDNKLDSQDDDALPTYNDYLDGLTVKQNTIEPASASDACENVTKG